MKASPVRRLLATGTGIAVAVLGLVALAATGAQTVVTVRADAEWTPAGIAVEAGKTYRIKAEGKWKMAFGCNATDAAGTGLRTSLFCFSPGGEPVPGANFQALVGRIGTDGPPFTVGTALVLTPDRAGQLYLRSNSTSLFDNSGVMTVTIAWETQRPWLGVQLQAVTREIADKLGLSVAGGALVRDVFANGPASRSIAPGDVILEFGNAIVSDPQELARLIAGSTIGVRVPVAIWRDGGRKAAHVTLGALEDREKLAAAAPAPAPEPSAPQALALAYPPGPERPDDVAVIIGNGNYRKLGRDIPDVLPAHADADEAKRYAMRALGIREGNVIDLRDATSAQIVRVFGTRDNPRGQLYDWVRPGRSRVFVYYAGHGAPGDAATGAYLVPSDADAARIDLNGYSLATLYRNLGKLPAESVTVVLESCFSGTSQAGSVITSASPVYAKVEVPKPPRNVTVISAGAANQIASWEQDKSHGLFTKYYLTGVAGAADKAPYGNGDGRVDMSEIDRYLKDTLTYYARRYYGRDQNAQISSGGMP